MNKIILILLGLIIFMGSCKKEESNPDINIPNEDNLNGAWIEGSWKFLYTDADSVVNNGSWTVTDTVYDINSTYVHWINNDNSQLLLTTYLDNDTAWVRGYYVGNGYNNGVTTVNVIGNSYLHNDVVSISGIDYKILNHPEYDNPDLDEEYRYYIELMILNPFNGCKYYLELFKRKSD